MCAYRFCDVCGNELEKMNVHKYGCLSCYIASGPDWPTRWLADSAVNTVCKVVALAEWRGKFGRYSSPYPST